MTEGLVFHWVAAAWHQFHFRILTTQTNKESSGKLTEPPQFSLQNLVQDERRDCRHRDLSGRTTSRHLMTSSLITTPLLNQLKMLCIYVRWCFHVLPSHQPPTEPAPPTARRVSETPEPPQRTPSSHIKNYKKQMKCKNTQDNKEQKKQYSNFPTQLIC